MMQVACTDMNGATYHARVWMGVCARHMRLMTEVVGGAPWAWSTWVCHMPFVFVDGVCGGDRCGGHVPRHMDVRVPGHPCLWVCRSFASMCVRSHLDVAVCRAGVTLWLLSCGPVAQHPSPVSHSRELAHGVGIADL